jgi:hypothetical protein
MISDIISITSSGENLSVALDLSRRVAAYGDLTKKNALHLRLLAEEMLSMMRSITGEVKGKGGFCYRSGFSCGIVAGGQGGNEDIVYDYSMFPQAEFSEELKADKAGYVSAIRARQIGLASQKTGAGRETKEDEIDLAAGIVLNKKVGDRVEKGELLATFYGNDPAKVREGLEEAAKAFEISDEQVERPELIKEIIGL